jgi:hypothetical protein
MPRNRLVENRKYLHFGYWTSITNNSSIFCDVSQWIPFKCNGCFEGTCRLQVANLWYLLLPSLLRLTIELEVGGSLTFAICFILGSCLAYSSVLKKGAIYFSIKSTDFQRTTYRMNLTKSLQLLLYSFPLSSSQFFSFICCFPNSPVLTMMMIDVDALFPGNAISE